MSLRQALTRARLRALAGGSFARGEAYHREGRVLSLEVRSADQIEGRVAGTERYETAVLVEDGALVTSCTCPVGARGRSPCKHAVALGLRFLDQGPVEADAHAGRIERGADPTEGPVFETTRDLEAWAAEHGVTHELMRSAEVLGPALERAVPSAKSSLSYLLGRWSLRDIGSADGAARYVGLLALRQPAVAAVRSQLEAARADLEVALEEERRPRRAPDDPLVERLWARLLELRAAVRGQASPRSRAIRVAGDLAFEPRQAMLVWREPLVLQLTTPTFARTTVATRLAAVPTLALSCVCRRDACTHGLALLDAALDLLADPTRSADARAVAEELLRPPWQRALAELEAGDSKASKPRSDIEVWWLIERELGTMTLTALVKKQLKRGGTTAGARMSAHRLLDDHGDVLPDQDLAIAQHLAAWQPGRRGATYPARAFAALVGHPRAVIEDDPELPLSVRRASLGFTALAVDRAIRIEPSVEGARFSPRLLAPLLEVHAPGEPLVVVEPEHGRCLLVDVTAEAHRLWAVMSRHGDTFPEESHAPLLDRLAQLGRAVPIHVPEALMGARLTETPTVVVRVRLTSDGALELQPYIRPAAGAPLFPPQAGPRDVLVVRGGHRCYVRRDLAGEAPLVAGLLARLPLDVAEEGPPGCWQLHDVDAALALVAAIQRPLPGLEVEWVDRAVHLSSSGGVENLTVRVHRKRDWFGIDGELTVEHGRIELAVLLDAARQQRRFVRIDDRRWVELSEAIRERLRAIADQTFVARDELELSPGAVPVIRALEAAGARVETTPSWHTLAERLAIAERLRPRPPAALEATLRPYQVEGHAWLARLAAWGAGACLADDMGLGKTIQAISLLLDRAKQGPALVLAPTSVTLNWVDELRRFAPTLRPVIYGEAADRAACLATLGRRDVLIASYGLLVRDVELLAGRAFGTLVLDEAQALKNHQTRRAKAARALDAGFRVALSGTPLENHLGELWSLFSIVFPGLLGSWEQFRTRFGVPIERDQNAEARAALSRLIRPFLLRRTKHEVAQELPARTEILVPISLSSEEAALYEDARLAALSQLGDKKVRVRDEQRRFQVLAALTRLRLLASHPRLYDPTCSIASSKMQRMLELIAELRAEGHRALVFSQFTSHLSLAREALADGGVNALYLDGATTARARAELIDRFQRGEGDVFLISLKAGGTGINLTAADYVIHLDPWWNPAVEDQATDRAHRIGQQRPVTVYRLVARGTVEEKILALHGDKRALVAGVLEGTDTAVRLTTRDLIALVGDQPPTATDRRGGAQA